MTPTPDGNWEQSRGEVAWRLGALEENYKRMARAMERLETSMTRLVTEQEASRRAKSRRSGLVHGIIAAIAGGSVSLLISTRKPEARPEATTPFVQDREP